MKMKTTMTPPLFFKLMSRWSQNLHRGIQMMRWIDCLLQRWQLLARASSANCCGTTDQITKKISPTLSGRNPLTVGRLRSHQRSKCSHNHNVHSCNASRFNLSFLSRPISYITKLSVLYYLCFQQLQMTADNPSDSVLNSLHLFMSSIVHIP